MALPRKLLNLFWDKSESIIFFFIFVLVIVVSIWSLQDHHHDPLMTGEFGKTDRDSLADIMDQEIGDKSIDSIFHAINFNPERRVNNQIQQKKNNHSMPAHSINKEKVLNRSKTVKQVSIIPQTIAINDSDSSQNYPSSTNTFIENEQEFGFLTVLLKNAHEYGYGYVFIDDKIWRQGNYNTTPLKLKLSVGNHKVDVRRDNFYSMPLDTVILIEKNMEKRVSFLLIPNKRVANAGQDL